METELVIIDAKRRLVGESPLWDDRNGVLLSVDFRGSTVRIQDLSGGGFREIELPGTASTLALCSGGGLLAALEDRLCGISPDGAVRTLFVPSSLKGRRFNDGKTGPDGRFYIGTKDDSHEAALYRYSPDGSFEEVLSRLGSSNGIDWSVDGRQLYLCDSLDRAVYAFDFDPGRGTVSNRRTVRVLPEGSGEFDGMCADAEDRLWCAVWGAGKLLRIRPGDGEILREVALPVSKPSSCAFAGDDLGMLAVTTASLRSDLTREPLAGQTFALRPGVAGRKARRFGTPCC